MKNQADSNSLSPSKFDDIIRRKHIKIVTTNEIPSTTGYSFYRNSSHFSSSEGEMCFKRELSNSLKKANNLKLDIMSIHNKINEDTDIIPYYKNPKFEKMHEKLSKRIKQIEKSKDSNLNELFNMINLSGYEKSQIMREYRCKDQNELIIKLYNEAKLSDIYLQKLDDLFILMSLKYNNENSNFEKTFHETNSKFLMMSELLVSLINHREKSAEFNNNVVKRLSKIPSPLQVNHCEVFEIVKSKEMNNGSSFLFDASNRMELTEFADDNPHVKTTTQNYDNTQLLTQNFTNRSSLSKKPSITSSVKSNTRRKSSKLIQKRYSEFENKYENNNNNNNQGEFTTEDYREMNETINHLRKVVDEFNKTLVNFKSSEEKRKFQLLDEVKDLGRKYDRIEERFKSIKSENDTLKKLLSNFESKIKIGPLNDYELVLKDELECLKSAFVRRIEELTSSYSDEKNSLKKKIKVLEDELRENKLLKDYFMKQVLK